ncbi:MAG: dihydrolipoyl dehydrogenase [Nitrospinae bacterium]|nr:dihydrolipoyl dehydrogenase [Nitrospinota bacterium]
MKSYDIAIIGGGPAGYPAAIRGAKEGKKVLLIENGELGGTCLNRGCIPTKTIIASVKAANMARRAEEFGLTIPSVSIDIEKIQRRKDGVIAAGRKGIETLLQKNGVELIRGLASLVSNKEIKIDIKGESKELIRGGNIIISTGSSPASIPIFPVDNVDMFDSDNIHALRKIPKSILIIGGGVIGCEFAYIFRSLGSEVTIVELLPGILFNEDQGSAAIIEREAKKKGIKIHKGIGVAALDKRGDEYMATLSDGKTVSAEKILVAAGRTPNSANLNLSDLGLALEDRGGIITNSRMETSVEGIYAAGDVTGRYPMAYVATHEGLTAAENIMGNPQDIKYNAIPRVVFFDPEMGSVGITEEEAIKGGQDIKIGTFLMRGLGKAQAAGELAGQVKIICDRKTDKVLGVHIVGGLASEIVHVGVMAIKNGMTSADIGDTLFAHPVFSEAILEAAWDIKGKSIHKV